MDNILRILEAHAGDIIIVLLIILVVESAVQLIIKQKKSFIKGRSKKDGFQQFQDQISRNGNEVFVLLCVDDNCTVYVSENVQKLLGVSQEDIMSDIHVLERLTQKSYIRELKRKLSQWDRTEPLETELAYYPSGRDGMVWGRITVSLTEDEKYYLCSLIDMTEEYEEKKRLEQQIEKAYESEQSKTRYISKMSHEIRTPMNGMLGMISLAKLNMDRREEAEDYLDKAEKLSQFLFSIINDILDMSRIESGKIELACERVDIFMVAEKLKDMFQVTVEDKGIRFVLEMQDFTVRYVMGDELRISQVMTNFLSNASKFTSSGGQITVTFRQMHIIEGKVNLMMRVRDTGKGMSPEFMSRIFNPFEQEDASVAKNYGGSGLGMAISDNLVSLMGGQITVDSEVGKGTDFTVFLELPIAEGEQKLPGKEGIHLDTESGEDSFSIEGLRILLAEDNKINALIATKLLVSQGAQIENALDGQEAVHMFREHEAGYYQVILMDIQMPGLDGWEATKVIRQLDREDAKSIPIIALSADAFIEDKRKSVEMGMNGHVSKPINFEELRRVIRDNM